MDATGLREPKQEERDPSALVYTLGLRLQVYIAYEGLKVLEHLCRCKCCFMGPVNERCHGRLARDVGMSA